MRGHIIDELVAKQAFESKVATHWEGLLNTLQRDDYAARRLDAAKNQLNHHPGCVLTARYKKGTWLRACRSRVRRRSFRYNPASPGVAFSLNPSTLRNLLAKMSGNTGAFSLMDCS